MSIEQQIEALKIIQENAHTYKSELALLDAINQVINPKVQECVDELNTNVESIISEL